MKIYKFTLTYGYYTRQAEYASNHYASLTIPFANARVLSFGATSDMYGDEKLCIWAKVNPDLPGETVVQFYGAESYVPEDAGKFIGTYCSQSGFVLHAFQYEATT